MSYSKKHIKNLVTDTMRAGIPEKEYMRKWYESRKDLYKERHLQKTYGISLEEMLGMLEDQKYLCKICSTDLNKQLPKNIHIDHNHTTGKIRGVLCGNCNKCLGLFKDDVNILKSAIKYLEINDASDPIS